MPTRRTTRTILCETCESLKVTPHVAQNTTNRSSAIDGRTTRHRGYAISQRKRKRVEEIFGWIKTVGLMRKTRHRGLARVGWMFTFTAAAYNLVRIRNLGAVVCLGQGEDRVPGPLEPETSPPERVKSK